MKKSIYFIYSVFLWVVIILTFVSHYLISPFIVYPFYKDKQEGYYNLAVVFLKIGFKIMGIKITLKEGSKIPKNENVLIVSNHQSLLDIMVLMIALPLRVTFFAKKLYSKDPHILYKQMEITENDKGRIM